MGRLLVATSGLAFTLRVSFVPSLRRKHSSFGGGVGSITRGVSNDCALSRGSHPVVSKLAGRSVRGILARLKLLTFNV